MHSFAIILASLLLAALATVLVHVLNSLPTLANRTHTTAFTDTQDTRLGQATSRQAAEHPRASGIYALPNALEAFAARILLARAAERSLDIQYYIWRKDMTGTMLFDALRAAADRGVRVRLLLDDNKTSGLDAILAALDSHPNIEVRLFNPFVVRWPRLIGYVTDFSRLNRRMHNKSFTADNQATIIGGRNIGDEYFDAVAEGSLMFADLDVLAAGPVVASVSNDFDKYWASGSAYPAERLLQPVDARKMARLTEAAAMIEADPAATSYVTAVRDTPLAQDLREGSVPFEWVPTRMVSDEPAKGLGRGAPEGMLMHKLREITGAPETELELVSPYFVPTAAGVEAFTSMANEGVHIRILVNSLEATDIDVVHSGYAKRREALLAAGIELYEMRLLPSEAGDDRRSAGSFGSGASSLHAKTFSTDRKQVFIGSFNFDPRSANLNTELGFIIRSPALARRLAELFDNVIPAVAYEVHRSDSGELYWTEQIDGRLVRHDTEPRTSMLQRAAVAFMSVLPIEWLL
ncbi:MAG TPA: phospholipase D family protein [Woeseiaceae bacterium]|nr:phospholipase D family protein [Woeseiaceae bacterium]